MTTTLRDQLQQAAGAGVIRPSADGVADARRRAVVLRRRQRAVRLAAPALAVLVLAGLIGRSESAAPPARVTTASSVAPTPTADEETTTTTTTVGRPRVTVTTTVPKIPGVPTTVFPKEQGPPTGSVAASAGRLAFVRGHDLYLRSGDSVTRLTHDNTFERGAPTWSPDGTRIAYTRSRYADGDVTRPPNGYTMFDLWVVDVATGQERRLYGMQDPSFATRPRWRPDGGRVLFAKVTPGPYSTATSAPMFEELAVKPDGSDVQKWTQPTEWAHRLPLAALLCQNDKNMCLFDAARNETRTIPNSSWNLTPQSFAWSPNDRSIVTDSDGLIILDIDGTHRHEVSAYGFGPSWSPDGTTIAFGMNDCIAVVDEDGANLRCLAGEDGDADPAWSPPVTGG
jgi:dipeptidyl aminopeptidase/acylaminoacyl peptidase